LQDVDLTPDSSRPPPVPLDPDARAQLAAWATEHWDNVYGLVYRLSGGSRQEADDLTQETFLRAGARRQSFTAGTNLRAWLLRIATNCFLDARRRKRTAKTEALPEEARAPASHVAPGHAAENRELAAALEAALAELAETPRAVFLLRTKEGMSFKEIADAIDATEETARWHMLQARRKLMQRLDGWV
jgi:RNA polymerase sigma-70 factor (ECF subfamily)